MQEINIVVTMDVELPTSATHESASGPPDYDTGDVWTRAFVELAAEYDCPSTLFIHPEVALARTDSFRDIAAKGNCLALHLHAWRFDSRFQCEFGGLTENESRIMLGEASALWKHAFGERPKFFRPGTLSANDSIFRVLAELGFRGGSVSLPGRVFSDKHAVWMGAPLDPHRGHADFRLIEGDLEFANMPISVDTSDFVSKGERYFYWDLRPDFSAVDHRRLVGNVLDQISARAPAVPCINLLTHNDNDFTDPNDRVRGNLVTVLEEIHRACSTRGIRPIGATLETVCEKVLELPPVPRSFDRSGGRILFDTDDRPR